MSRRRASLLPDEYDAATVVSRQHAFVVSRFSTIEYEVWRTIALTGPKMIDEIAAVLGHVSIEQLQPVLAEFARRFIAHEIGGAWALREDLPWAEPPATVPAPAPRPDVEPWWEGPLLCLDTETTHTDPRIARIVSIALLGTTVEDGHDVVGAGLIKLVNPGVPIPADATRVHGITDDQVQQLGRPLGDTLEQIFRRLGVWGHPLVIYNAPYDWTLLHVEAARVGLTVPEVPVILDPLTIERYLRARGSGHTLGAVAKRYNLAPEGALHGARADALLAGRILRAQARELLPRMTLPELMHAQPAWHRVWRMKQNAWRRAAGKPLLTGGWPLQ